MLFEVLSFLVEYSNGMVTCNGTVCTVQIVDICRNRAANTGADPGFFVRARSTKGEVLHCRGCTIPGFDQGQHQQFLGLDTLKTSCRSTFCVCQFLTSSVSSLQGGGPGWAEDSVDPLLRRRPRRGSTSGSRGSLGARPPLPPRLFQNHAVFRQL